MIAVGRGAPRKESPWHRCIQATAKGAGAEVKPPRMQRGFGWFGGE